MKKVALTLAAFAGSLAAQSEVNESEPVDRQTHQWTRSQLDALFLTLADQPLLPLYKTRKAADQRLATRVKAGTTALHDALKWLVFNGDQEEANRLAWIGFDILAEYREKTGKPAITAREIMNLAEKRVAAATEQRKKDEVWAKTHSMRQVYKVSTQVYPRHRNLKPEDRARLSPEEQRELRKLDTRLARLQAEMGGQPDDLRTRRTVHELALRAIELLDKAEKGNAIEAKPKPVVKAVDTEPEVPRVEMPAPPKPPKSEEQELERQPKGAKEEPAPTEAEPAARPEPQWSAEKVDALVRTVRKVPELNPRVSNSTLRNLNRLHKNLMVSVRTADGVTTGRLFNRMSRDANMLLKAYNRAVPSEHRATIESFGDQ